MDVREYDVIFTGTPNWCGTIAPPLVSWLTEHDLTGKTVVPFWSHCGGWIGNIEKDIRKLCPKSDLRGELRVINDGGSELPEKIAAWLEKLGI